MMLGFALLYPTYNIGIDYFSLSYLLFLLGCEKSLSLLILMISILLKKLRIFYDSLTVRNISKLALTPVHVRGIAVNFDWSKFFFGETVRFSFLFTLLPFFELLMKCIMWLINTGILCKSFMIRLYVV